MRQREKQTENHLNGLHYIGPLTGMGKCCIVSDFEWVKQMLFFISFDLEYHQCIFLRKSKLGNFELYTQKRLTFDLF